MSGPTWVALVTAIAAAFGGSSGGSGESLQIFDGVNSALGGFLAGGSDDDEVPPAYLNYILFDQQYKVLDAGWERVPTSANFAKQEMTLPAKYITEAGYYFTYLSYEGESNNYVYFDDYNIKHVKSRLIQGNEYYPFGLQTAGSWTRENTLDNNFLANGGTELNKTSNLYDLEYRNYDQVLGRMNGVDPMTTKYASLTPYNFSFNDPVTFTDVSGADPHDDWLEEQRALESWFNNTMPPPMDPGGGGFGSSGYYGSVMGGYGATVSQHMNSIGFSNGIPGITYSNGTWTIHMDRIGSQGGTWTRGSGYSEGVPSGYYSVPVYEEGDDGYFDFSTQMVRRPGKVLTGTTRVYFEGTRKMNFDNPDLQMDGLLGEGEATQDVEVINVRKYMQEGDRDHWVGCYDVTFKLKQVFSSGSSTTIWSSKHVVRVRSTGELHANPFSHATWIANSAVAKVTTYHEGSKSTSLKMTGDVTLLPNSKNTLREFVRKRAQSDNKSALLRWFLGLFRKSEDPGKSPLPIPIWVYPVYKM